MERRLTAILAADVVGFSRLMGADEAGKSAAAMALHKELFAPKVGEHRGRIVKLMGRPGALSDTVERTRQYGSVAGDALGIVPEDPARRDFAYRQSTPRVRLRSFAPAPGAFPRKSGVAKT